MNEDRPNDRDSLQEYFEALSPGERRERIYLRPEFRDAYNEITEAHRVFILPQYYFKHWRHILGPVAHTLYEELRRRTYYNPQTGERRDSFYATQQELGHTIGVKDPKTTRKALALLEEHGFISRQVRHYTNPKTGRPYRGADEITVYFEVPLTTEDAVELLLRTTLRDTTAVLGKKSLVRPREPGRHVDNSAVPGNFSPLRAGEIFPSNVSTSNDTYQNNVSMQKTRPEKGSLRTDPRVQAMNPEERESRDNMAQEIGRQLNVMAGDRDFSTEDHKSLGFHRRVAFLMPQRLVYEALAATRDAIDDERAGRKTVRGVDAYFAGIVQRIAERERIDLGVEWKAKHPSEAI